MGYIRNSIHEKEKDKVETHLLACELCYDAYEGISTLDKNEDSGYHLASLIQDIKIKFNAGLLRKNRKIFFSAAAMLIVICTAIFLLLRPESSAELFEEYYKPYPNIIPMVRGEGIDFDLKASMVLYNSGNYEEAVLEFDKILSIQPQNEIASFYKGVSLLSLEKGTEAEVQFKLVLNTGSNLIDQAEWYLSLTYLLNDNVNSAEEMLEKISFSKNYYSDKAGALLKKLQKKE